MKKSVLSAVAAAMAFAAAQPAAGHVVFLNNDANAGTNIVRPIIVGDGCDGSPTTSLTVSVPENVRFIRPIRKEGWRTRLIHGDPTESSPNGKVEKIEFYGGWLEEPDQDLFNILIALTDYVGPIYFETVQKCASGEIVWNEVAGPGEEWSDLQMPAPLINVRPALAKIAAE